MLWTMLATTTTTEPAKGKGAESPLMEVCIHTSPERRSGHPKIMIAPILSSWPTMLLNVGRIALVPRVP